MRSKMCDSGRKLRVESVGPTENDSRALITFDQMLSWVSITPLGSPVVPDV